MAISRADIDAILATFEASDWRTIHLAADGVEIMLSKDGDALPAVTKRPATAAPPAAPAPTLAPVAAAVPDDGTRAVPAPSLGTFYRAPKPGAPAFIEIGSHVAAGDDLCLVEVMKLFTSVKAPCAGIITAILASDGDLVEHGQTLFRIKPDA